MAFTADVKNEVITKYLIKRGQQGATVADICAATGISQASMYRLIARHPAIVKMETPGRTVYYRLDVSKLVPVKSSKAKGVTIPVEPNLVKQIQSLSAYDFAEQIRQYTKQPREEYGGLTKFEFDRAQLGKAMENSINFQTGADSIDPEIMRSARESIDRLENFGRFLLFYMQGIKQHKEYTSDTEWWAIWPKD